MRAIATERAQNALNTFYEERDNGNISYDTTKQEKDFGGVIYKHLDLSVRDFIKIDKNPDGYDDDLLVIDTRNDEILFFIEVENTTPRSWPGDAIPSNYRIASFLNRKQRNVGFDNITLYVKHNYRMNNCFFNWKRDIKRYLENGVGQLEYANEWDRRGKFVTMPWQYAKTGLDALGKEVSDAIFALENVKVEVVK